MLRKLVAAVLPLHRDHSRDEVADGLPGARAELLLEALAALPGEANVVGGGHEKKILGVVADRGVDVVGLEELGLDELPDGLDGSAGGDSLALPLALDLLPIDALSCRSTGSGLVKRRRVLARTSPRGIVARRRQKKSPALASGL